MRFGICTAIDNIEKVEKMGFDYLEANASGIAALSEEDFQKTLELVKNAKIGCECFNVLFPKTISVVGPDKNAEEMEKYGIGNDPGTPLTARITQNHAAWILTYNNEHGILDWLMNQVKE